MHSPERAFSNQRLSARNAQRSFDGRRGGFVRRLLKLQLQRPSFGQGGPGRGPVKIHKIIGFGVCVCVCFNIKVRFIFIAGV